MNAIRRDDEMDNIHSVFVDQWDWERVITEGERNVEFLKETAKKVAEAVFETHRRIKRLYPVLTRRLDEEVYFITSGELEERYPDLTPKERERAILREHHTTFLMQIGEKLKNGLPHDGRSPDYDDWTLNGDLLFWNELLESPLELSSMGIRVDAAFRYGRKNEISLSPNGFKRTIAFDDRRRNRAVENVPSSAGKIAYRRGAGVRMGRGRCGGV